MRMDGRQIGVHAERLIACVTRCTFL